MPVPDTGRRKKSHSMNHSQIHMFQRIFFERNMQFKKNVNQIVSKLKPENDNLYFDSRYTSTDYDDM